VAAAVRQLSRQPAPATASAAATSAAGDDTLPEPLRQGLQQLQPGTATRQQAQQALGEPTERQSFADAEVWVYNPRKRLPPLVGWLPVLGDVLEVAELAHQRLRRHELILPFDTTGVLRRRTVRALDS
jgi:outer membrane protein assembly factor BamE (lipoprotein component of BamABCDE complex)